MTVATIKNQYMELIRTNKILVMPGKVWFGKDVSKAVQSEFFSLYEALMQELCKNDPPGIYFPNHDQTPLEIVTSDRP